MLGTITKRFAAYLLLGLVVAMVTTSASAARTSLNVLVTPSMNTMKFVFTTPVPSTVTLSMGTDRSYGLAPQDGLKKTHRITVRGLRPGTAYYCAIRATPKRGKALTWSAPCPTSQVAPASFSTRNGIPLQGGNPSFPVILYLRDCPDSNSPDYLDRLGAQIIGAGSCLAPPPADNSDEVQQLNNILTGKAWWLEPNSANLPQLSSLAMLLTSRERLGNFPTDPGSLLGCGSKSGAGLANAVRQAGTAVPAIADLYIASQLSPSVQNCLDPARLSALVWEAVAAGAKGIEFVPQLPWNSQYDVASEVEQQAKALVLRIATLQPALLTAPVAASASGSLIVGAHRYLGTTYVVAVNPTVEAAQGSITIPSTKSKQASVWREGRSVKLVSHGFSDHFGPLAVHIYTMK